MIQFILGIVVGLLIAILIFIVEVYLRPRNKGFPQLERIIREKTAPKGAILFPKQKPIEDQVLSILNKKDE